jgi:predicted ABC-type ATPase
VVNTPLAVVIAGPNGAGKSTTAPRLLRDALAVSEFVNADAIAAGLSAFRPESVAMAAGRVMLARLGELAREHVSFAFETTLASRGFAAWLERVAERVGLGGHDVPESVIRRRFAAGLRNLFTLYLPLVDRWRELDNSEATGPRLIASGRAELEPEVMDPDAWRALLEKSR